MYVCVSICCTIHILIDDRDEDEEGDDYELDYASLNANPELLRMLGASERVIAAKEAEVSAIVSTWAPPPEPGLENSTTIIADSAAVVLGSGKAPCGSGVARVSKLVGGFDQDAAAAAATAQEAPGWKVSSKDESWDEASANRHAWWESGSEDEEYEMMSAMSPNLQAVLGLRRPSGTDTANAEQGDNKNEWHPPSFAGLSNSRRVTVLRPLVVGHGKMFDVEYRNRGQQEEEEGEDGDGDDDLSEGEGWDYQGITFKAIRRTCQKTTTIRTCGSGAPTYLRTSRGLWDAQARWNRKRRRCRNNYLGKLRRRLV
ncbi:hypothetical protein Esi_0059_0020 [Ectocarpus siliculosus]|uniref:Uncharacterized protein n=1 Tax=Ectocarpus siliculosus TaxID=2880 RepID=D8LQ41_ECTSI|nr:hypothetical protein Esi_0059_0020 [Ectocarpus siliculosus]|eukprot:CBN77421.1 hypothetical protein Esi_0059_0020 [Ectocarpus siliculosus]